MRRRVRMSISEVSVRWTGHFSAISTSLARCRSVSGPVRTSSTSMWSIHPGARLAFGAVGRVDAPVLQLHRDRLERPAPSAGVQPDGHRGTRAQGGEEEVVRVRPAIRAAGRRRLIGRQPMRVDLDLLRKSLDAAMDDHVVHIVILACPVSAAMYSGASTRAVPPKKNASISSFCDSASVRPISMSGRV